MEFFFLYLVVRDFSNDLYDVIVFIIVKIETNVLWINIGEINVELVVTVRTHFSFLRFLLFVFSLSLCLGRCLDSGMNKDGKIHSSIHSLSRMKSLAVQNERGPRQPFPDRHMHITGSFNIKPEVSSSLFIELKIDSDHLVFLYSSGTSNSSLNQPISINSIV